VSPVTFIKSANQLNEILLLEQQVTPGGKKHKTTIVFLLKVILSSG
jgi:hypothetical protein